jgi:lipopolysaccharide export system protein LptA
MRTLAAATLVLLGLGRGAPAATDPPKPVEIEANQMEIVEAERKALFRGGVVARRADVTLKCDELVVEYDDVKQPDGTTRTDATSLNAKGAVEITTARETITGDWAKFDPRSNALVVGGSVRLVQGSTVLTGGELKADLDTDRIELGGGRVRGSFLPR